MYVLYLSSHESRSLKFHRQMGAYGLAGVDPIGDASEIARGGNLNDGMASAVI